MFILLFILLHELAHVITIKSLNLSIYNVGIKLKPIPHFFVEFMWSRKQKENNLILLSGTLCTLTLFGLSFIFNFFNNKILMNSFLFQLVIETNPFYSDFVSVIVLNKKLNYEQSVTKQIKEGVGRLGPARRRL